MAQEREDLVMCSQLKHSPDYEALIKRQLERENGDEQADKPKSILKKEEKNYEVRLMKFFCSS